MNEKDNSLSSLRRRIGFACLRARYGDGDDGRRGEDDRVGRAEVVARLDDPGGCPWCVVRGMGLSTGTDIAEKAARKAVGGKRAESMFLVWRSVNGSFPIRRHPCSPPEASTSSVGFRKIR